MFSVGISIDAPVRILFPNRFICLGVDISIHVLLTGGQIYYLPV